MKVGENQTMTNKANFLLVAHALKGRLTKHRRVIEEEISSLTRTMQLARSLPDDCAELTELTLECERTLAALPAEE